MGAEAEARDLRSKGTTGGGGRYPHDIRSGAPPPCRQCRQARTCRSSSSARSVKGRVGNLRFTSTISARDALTFRLYVFSTARRNTVVRNSVSRGCGAAGHGHTRQKRGTTEVDAVAVKVGARTLAYKAWVRVG